MARDPKQIASKWARNLQGAQGAIQEGVRSVTESPTEKAARRADAYVQGVQRAAADGKWQEALRSVSLEQWREAMLVKGVGRVGTGAQAAIPKVEAFLSEFLPHVEAGQRKLASMPRGDLSANIARAVAMIEHNAQFRRSRR
jgi:hypothetical protein